MSEKRLTKGQFIECVRLMANCATDDEFKENARCEAMFSEHDPELGRLLRDNNDTRMRVAEYCKRRLG